MRLYVASPFCLRDTVTQTVVELLEQNDFEITSSWIQSTREISEATVGTSLGSSDDDARKHADMDILDIQRSEGLLMISSEYAIMKGYDGPTEWLHTGGRHVEVGVALTTDIPVHILGAPENVFGRGLAFVHADEQAFLDWVVEHGL